MGGECPTRFCSSEIILTKALSGSPLGMNRRTLLSVDWE